MSGARMQSLSHVLPSTWIRIRMGPRVHAPACMLGRVLSRLHPLYSSTSASGTMGRAACRSICSLTHAPMSTDSSSGVARKGCSSSCAYVGRVFGSLSRLNEREREGSVSNLHRVYNNALLKHSPLGNKVPRVGRVAQRQGRRRAVDNGGQLGKDIGKRLGRVGIGASGKLNDGQADRPHV